MHDDQASAASEPAAPEEGGRRRSRAAATHAKQAMSRLNDPEDMDYNPATPAPAQASFVAPARGRGGRGRGRGSGSGKKPSSLSKLSLSLTPSPHFFFIIKSRSRPSARLHPSRHGRAPQALRRTGGGNRPETQTRSSSGLGRPSRRREQPLLHYSKREGLAPTDGG